MPGSTPDQANAALPSSANPTKQQSSDPMEIECPWFTSARVGRHAGFG
jgi:hypothetical protein